ncbi:uncharacterized protein KY384_001569 [Bacidia gigantensis]|uniref:uncharacterized protein n=1 Tax=Bacidia gigantensis TaxID=2732470 RepID=UPI001D052AB9|nr:uncharacterized protein KY384_001569 [Bacidia gigantensis]KAG8533828.1 hypothetical protein KY384_001569 [Bacidia gigantensis]
MRLHWLPRPSSFAPPYYRSQVYASWKTRRCYSDEQGGKSLTLARRRITEGQISFTLQRAEKVKAVIEKKSKKSKERSSKTPHNVQDQTRKQKTEQALWFSHPSSPGSPIFTPGGTYVIQKLQAFLRAQYAEYGFQEVITPLMYKRSLWEQSGHWENYKDDMYSVHSGKQSSDKSGDNTFGLKPMNCPGHCVLFSKQRWSYNDLPVRYADFSPLHRDEVSGALSGLTRVRRFHQDDGHIFCRPSQIENEIASCLSFTDTVYRTLGIEDYELVLSTRPDKDFIGTREEWTQAERQLKDALDRFGRPWRYQRGEGAFYGPKIDFIVLDSVGKSHQIGTTQLDFQLPKRFGLKYAAPAKVEGSSGTMAEDGISFEPVMIHRAIFGSLERFLALFIDKHDGQWPFWLNPNPVAVLTVTDDQGVREMATRVAQNLRYPMSKRPDSELGDPFTFGLPLPLSEAATFTPVHLNTSDETLGKKLVLTKDKGTGLIVIIGQRNVKDNTVDVQVSAVLEPKKVWSAIEEIKPGSQAPIKKDTGTGKARGQPGVKLSVVEFQKLSKNLADAYI